MDLSMTNFWKLASALKEYSRNEGNGCLPLRGDLPDMTSSSSRYLKLLSVYKEAADLAVEQLSSRLSHVRSCFGNVFLMHSLVDQRNKP